MGRSTRIWRRLWNFLWSRRAYRFLIKDWISLEDLGACSDVIKTMRFSRNLSPIPMDIPVEKRIVVIAPHPDDDILGAGGTLLKAISKGAEVSIIYLTSGKDSMAGEVERETRDVAKRFGFRTEFLRYPLNRIGLQREVLEHFSSILRSHVPQALFVPFLLDDHDDHRRANQLLLQAYLGGMIPERPVIWAYQVYGVVLPNVVVDITGVKQEKALAIRMWQSQQTSRDWAHYILGLNAFNSRFLRSPRASYVEPFFVVPFGEYMNWCSVYFSGKNEEIYYTPFYREEGNKGINGQ
jgi:LmbE family N-acetylglucosaminyl deacetylase